jgi:CRISPR-associated endoribonuclease Cas6
MLIAIVLTLVSETAGTLPAHLGRANYAATLGRLGQIDVALAAQCHEGDGPKPLTCSGLMGETGRREGTQIEPGKPYLVRVTGLTTAVSQALEAGLLAQRPERWTLDEHVFQVVEAVCDATAQPWSGRSSYEQLAAAQLAQGPAGSPQPERQATLRFASPVSFKSGGMHVPVPLPGLVFGSLVERWNAFSPAALSGEMRRFGEEMVAISRYRLESRAVAQKNQGLRIGGVGEATYTALGGDRYWTSVMQMLAEFALYSGVGVQTATGMGQARRVR